MYNKKLTVCVTATTPSASSDSDELTTNMMIGLVAHKQSTEILDDVEFGEAKDGLKTLLETNLPIKYPVSLAYTGRADAVLKFPGCDPIDCELGEIEISKPDSEKLIQVKLKIFLEDVSAEDAGTIVTNLKKTIDITIESVQEELFK